MKKTLLALSVLLATANASAAVDGAYLGAQLGYGNIYQPNTFAQTTTTGGSGVFAGRVFAGYQISEYFAMEAGFTKFANTNLNFIQTLTPPLGTFTGSGTEKVYALDLVAKGTLPLENGFSLFAKFGGAYLNETTDPLTLKNTVNATSIQTGEYDQSKVLPTFGLGAGYDITPNLTTDISWMRIQNVGNNNLQSTDLIALGLTYHIGFGV